MLWTIFLYLIKLEVSEALSCRAYLWETVGLLPARGCLSASVCAATCVYVYHWLHTCSECALCLFIALQSQHVCPAQQGKGFSLTHSSSHTVVLLLHCPPALISNRSCSAQTIRTLCVFFFFYRFSKLIS